MRGADELPRTARAFREEYERLHSALLTSAAVDRELARSKSPGPASITSMTDCVVEIGRNLRQELILRAEFDLPSGQLQEKSCAELTEAERAALQQDISSFEERGEALLDNDARRFLSECGPASWE